VYSGGESEEIVGKALAQLPADRRDDVVLATKVHGGMGDDPNRAGNSRRWIVTEVENSLRRLQVDHVDLYQIHRPDPDTPIEETLTVLGELIQAGKVREIGCSNFTPAMIDEATTFDGVHFVTVQNELSLLRRKGDIALVDACERDDLHILPYFPLSSGMLTGKYKRGEAPPEGTRIASAPDERRERALSDRNFDLLEALDAFATSRGHTLLELAMSWLAGLPRMGSVIAGATSPEQIKANAGAVGWALTADERAEVDRISA
jgi:aryl-alcohol dehydrogenase-like predicted oxidoreductase